MHEHDGDRFGIPDDLSIPEFLKRELPPGWQPPGVHRRRGGKIAYPRDGYACKGMREAAREKHRARLRRRADRMRQPRRK
jgi:hypothetical protein